MVRTPNVDSKPLQVRSTLPWFQKALSRGSSYIPKDKRKWYQSVGANTIGETAGIACIGLSIADLIYNLFFKDDEKSFFRKSLTPILGTFLGMVGIGVSKPPSNVFEVDLINSGALNVIDTIKDLKKKGKALLETFTNDESTKIGETIRSILSNLRHGILRSIKASVPVDERADFDLHFPEDISLLQLCMYASQNDRGKKVLSNFCNIENNPNIDLLDDFRNIVAKKLKPLGIELHFGYDKKYDLFNVYFRTIKVYSDPSASEKTYSPCLILSTKPYYLYAALNHIEKRLDEARSDKAHLKAQSNDNYLGAELASALKEAVGIIEEHGLKRAGRFEVVDGKVQSKPLLNENIRRVDPSGNISKLFRILTQDSSGAQIDEASLFGVQTGVIDDPPTGDGIGRDGPGPDIDDQPGGPQGDDDSERIISRRDKRIDSLRKNTFDYLNFKLSSGEASEIRRLKLCLIKARANALVGKIHCHPDEKIDLLEEAIWGRLRERRIECNEQIQGNSMPQDLVKLEYFERAAESMIGDKPIDAKLKLERLERLFDIINPLQAAVLREALRKK